MLQRLNAQVREARGMILVLPQMDIAPWYSATANHCCGTRGRKVLPSVLSLSRQLDCLSSELLRTVQRSDCMIQASRLMPNLHAVAFYLSSSIYTVSYSISENAIIAVLSKDPESCLRLR
jgi:hypothetical protein